jgi:heme ABC exporter ATP-binding subunit CcmA
MRPVLRDVSFEMHEGEAVFLFGRNGCGKTTLLKILSGLMRPEKGTAELAGSPLFTSNGTWRKAMNYLGHRPNLYPSLTARENLKLALHLRGQAWDDARFRELLAAYGLVGRDNEAIQVFSEGMLQRLGVIRLELTDWQVAFLDEPTSALDVDGADVLSKAMGDWIAQGRSLLFTSHDMHWGADQADWALLLERGLVANLFDHPGPDDLMQFVSGAGA